MTTSTLNSVFTPPVLSADQKSCGPPTVPVWLAHSFAVPEPSCHTMQFRPRCREESNQVPHAQSSTLTVSQIPSAHARLGQHYQQMPLHGFQSQLIKKNLLWSCQSFIKTDHRRVWLINVHFLNIVTIIQKCVRILTCVISAWTFVHPFSFFRWCWIQEVMKHTVSLSCSSIQILITHGFLALPWANIHRFHW